MKTHRHPKFKTISTHTQSGGAVDFNLPTAALLYDTGLVSLTQQDKVDNTMDDLYEAFEAVNLN